MEFKYDAATDALNFLEINLSCNLWSKKAVPFSARGAGVEYPELIETILCHSMLRQGLISPADLI
jgi:D-alanine-D-alanine ligase